MRNDMYKVIVERPRPWKGGHADAVQRRDDLDGPTHLSMRAGYAGRFLNENLAPLRRYLRSQVGRPWVKVFSEISAGIDRRNTVQQHIYEHIDGFIAIAVDFQDGRLVDLRNRDRFRAGYPELSQELFVDPHSGLIRLNEAYRARSRQIAERRRQEQAQLVARRRILNDRTVLLRIEDLWFEVTLAELPAGRTLEQRVGGECKRKVVFERRYDVVLRREIQRYQESDERERVYGSSNLYAVSKRQLSKREMKAHGLRE
jgi:hypothetical protein